MVAGDRFFFQQVIIPLRACGQNPVSQAAYNMAKKGVHPTKKQAAPKAPRTSPRRTSDNFLRIFPQIGVKVLTLDLHALAVGCTTRSPPNKLRTSAGPKPQPATAARQTPRARSIRMAGPIEYSSPDPLQSQAWIHFTTHQHWEATIDEIHGRQLKERHTT